MKKKNFPDFKVSDDVKFDVQVKKVEEKADEFDDDEENPLAKIPVRQRDPKQKVGRLRDGN